MNLDTSVGTIELPKFKNFALGNEFLTLLSESIHEQADYKNFENIVIAKKLGIPKYFV